MLQCQKYRPGEKRQAALQKQVAKFAAHKLDPLRWVAKAVWKLVQ